jgi:hypothetical protein
VSFAKIQEYLHFTPEWTVERGVKQVVDALTTGGIKDYRDPRYSNVKFLSEEGALQMIRRRDGWIDEIVRIAVAK